MRKNCKENHEKNIEKIRKKKKEKITVYFGVTPIAKEYEAEYQKNII